MNSVLRTALAATVLAHTIASGTIAADFSFYGRSGDAIEVNFAALPGVPAGATFSDLALNAGYTSHTLLGSALTGVPFLTAGRFWAYPNPAAPGDISSERGWQGTMSGTFKINGETKSFDVVVRPGYTGSGPGSVGQSLEAINRPANNKIYVAQQQQRLRYLGFVPQGGSALVIDGDFGPATNSALKTFQAATLPGVNATQANADGIIGPNTAAWLNAANAPAWVRLTGNSDVWITTGPEQYATSWTADLIYKGSAKAMQAMGHQQGITALSTADGYGSSQWHSTHLVGTDIDLYTEGWYGRGNGTLSALESRVAARGIGFIDAGAAGQVTRIITSNYDVRNRILELRPGTNVFLDSTDVHANHLHIDVGPPTRIAGVANLPGDFDLNDVVDATDYIIWRKGLGITYTQSDYNLWRANFGRTLGSSGGSGGAVPEPAISTLLLLAASGMFLRRRPATSSDSKSR